MIALIIKYWAKQKGLICAERFSSYSFNLLIVFYMQNVTGGALPTIQFLKNLAEEKTIVNGIDYSFYNNAKGIGMCSNIQTVLALLVGFFKFYRDFDINSFGVDTCKGIKVDKNPKWSEDAMVCVDPFTGENVLSGITYATVDLLKNEVKKVANSIDEINCLSLLIE